MKEKILEILKKEIIGLDCMYKQYSILDFKEGKKVTQGKIILIQSLIEKIERLEDSTGVTR